MSRPLINHIDLAALQHNYALIKKKAGLANVFAVVKANAYGHGLLPVVQALQQDAAGFALLEIESACQLREQGIKQPILLLEGVFEPTELLLCQQYELLVTVHNSEQVRWVEQLTSGPPIGVFLKINSGMNRLGIKPDVINEVLNRLQVLPQIKNICLMTHFATADDTDEGIMEQWELFKALHQRYPNLPICAANSAAMLRYPYVHGQWVRAGIALYGSSPFTDVTASELELHPVMHLESELIAVQEITPHQAVGYGKTFIADKPMRIGMVACGYADGYPRHAPNGTPVLVNGQRCRLVGRVSMDILGIDVSEVNDARIGSSVELWGKNLSIDEVAYFAGTISYEMMSAITARVRCQYG